MEANGHTAHICAADCWWDRRHGTVRQRNHTAGLHGATWESRAESWGAIRLRYCVLDSQAILFYLSNYCLRNPIRGVLLYIDTLHPSSPGFRWIVTRSWGEFLLFGENFCYNVSFSVRGKLKYKVAFSSFVVATSHFTLWLGETFYSAATRRGAASRGRGTSRWLAVMSRSYVTRDYRDTWLSWHKASVSPGPKKSPSLQLWLAMRWPGGGGLEDIHWRWDTIFVCALNKDKKEDEKAPTPNIGKITYTLTSLIFR